MDLATFCEGLEVASEPPLTAQGADALTAIRISDPGMDAFYRGLMGRLAKTGTTRPSACLRTIIRAMIWDFAARTPHPADITLWFGFDSPIAAAAPLSSSGKAPDLEDTNVCI